MAKLLFRLNGVDESEADEVRALLEEFDTYETHAGRWGLSVAAIWLKDEDAFDDARAVIDDYQQQRSERLQQEFSQQPIVPFWQRVQQRPADHIAVAIAIALVLALMVWPFTNW
ncbi:hypothetical protein CHH28_00250 [Bacterioplanes sanyensis]|uniref:DUF2007 domain-containing protein n=1 Tax=Bacterioplanes sanyensis TaxID=1249553 RepID=A0A222FEP2_9GAMM|nr:DUF6164 family protein [Bacterioplanes sanyensis]ASP37209.1 hypothetical protein CHH28_00250 [Bacterioplanes sanyensis]